MVFSIIPKNAAQAISGSVNTSEKVTVLQATPALAYTCPAGKRASVHVTTLIYTLTNTQNLRFRVAGILIMQRGISEIIPTGGAGAPVFVDLGMFHIDENQTISCTTSNVGTEGGVIILNAAVLSEIPR